MCGGLSREGVASYVVTLPDGTKAALPMWMTESSAGCSAEAHEDALVSITALAALHALVDAVRKEWARSAISATEPPDSGETP